MNVLYLNLDRRPDRNQSFLENLYANGVSRDKIHRFTGYDAKSFTGYFENLPPLVPKHPVKTEQSFRAIICNFMGHVRMWQFIVDKHLPVAIISQDDVVFAPELYASDKVFQLPCDFEVVWLGYMIGRGDRPVPLLKDSSKYALELVNDDVMTIPYNNGVTNPCSMCYFISQQGARNLLAAFHASPFIQEADWWMNKYLSDKGIHYMTRKAYATNRFELGSDIFTLKAATKSTSKNKNKSDKNKKTRKRTFRR